MRATERRHHPARAPAQSLRRPGVIALLAAGPRPVLPRVGTSAATRPFGSPCLPRSGRQITTFEVIDEKVALARETFKAAGVGD